MALPDISPYLVKLEHVVIASGTQVSTPVAMVPARFLGISVQSLQSALRMEVGFTANSADFRELFIPQAPGATVFTNWQLDVGQTPGAVSGFPSFVFPFIRAKTLSATTVPTTITMVLAPVRG